jgi:hypothetical protein
MNPASDSDMTPKDMSLPEYQSALFANLVIQQTSLAMMFLGQIAHPETGQSMLDLEGARFIIDQLEMIQAKTKGNLSSDEEKILKESLTSLHMTFVRQANAPAAQAAAPAPAPAVAPAPAAAPTPAPGPAAEDTESKKKFTKKYGQE